MLVTLATALCLKKQNLPLCTGALFNMLCWISIPANSVLKSPCVDTPIRRSRAHGREIRRYTGRGRAEGKHADTPTRRTRTDGCKDRCIDVSGHSDAVRGPQWACGREVRRCTPFRKGSTPICRSTSEIRGYATFALTGQLPVHRCIGAELFWGRCLRALWKSGRSARTQSLDNYLRT